MSTVSDVFKKQILRIFPTRETLAAIKRLEAGKGIKVSYRELLDIHIKVYPEYAEAINKRYDDELHMLRTHPAFLGGSVDIESGLQIILDPSYEKKLELAKKHYKLTAEEVATYENNLRILKLGGILRSRFKPHSLTKKGTKDLTGYWSFVVHKDTRRVSDDKKETVICLYKPTRRFLYLANFGRHDKVYRQGSITSEFHKPDTKYKKVPLKDIYNPREES